MRLAIVVAPGVGRVGGMVGSVSDLRVAVSDRAANVEGFNGEYIIRLPRRFTSSPLSAVVAMSDELWRDSVAFARRVWGIR